MSEGGFREGVAQQCGFRTPAASDYEEGTNSSPRLAVCYPGATVAVPGVVTSIAEKVAGDGRSEAQGNTALPGKVYVSRLVDCAVSSPDT